MNATEFSSKIRASWRVLDELDLIRTVSSINSLDVSAEFNEIALDVEQSYRSIYIRAVSLSYYNLMLNDYSLFQFSWVSQQSWRLAYLPNPWIAGVNGAQERITEWEALEALGGYDAEEVAQLIGELPYFGSIPPFRFEFASDQYRELAHPSAHIHIGRHTENRWPVSKLLNPLTFSMMIAKMYYVDTWGQASEFYAGRELPCLDKEFIKELERAQAVHEFSEMERRSLHFASR